MSVTTNASLTDSTLDGNAVVGGVAGGPGVGGVAGQGGGSTISSFFSFPFSSLVGVIFVGVFPEAEFIAPFITTFASLAVTSRPVRRPEHHHVAQRLQRCGRQLATNGIAQGGGVYLNAGKITLLNDTITQNSADEGGGCHQLLGANAPVVNIGNTVIAQNNSGLFNLNPDIEDPQNTDIDDLGHNFIGAESGMAGACPTASTATARARWRHR